MGATITAAPVWAMHAERWRKTLRSKNLSAHTMRGYLYTARRWAEWLDEQGLNLEPDDIQVHHVEDFIGDIIEATSAANGAHHYRNMRVFCGWLVRREQMTKNPMDQTEPPNVPETITPVLSDEDHAAVLLACSGKDLISLRDTAIVLLFVDTGMRVSELHSLDVNDLDLKTKQFVIRGKGDKVRWVRFGASTGLALAASKNLTPAQRTLRASAAAHASWALTTDRRARTEAARQAALRRFEHIVDPNRELPPDERERRASSARRAYFRQLALRSARKRARPEE